MDCNTAFEKRNPHLAVDLTSIFWDTKQCLIISFNECTTGLYICIYIYIYIDDVILTLYALDS